MDRSKKWPMQRANQRQPILLSHLAASGRDLYFIGPYNVHEGYRAAEYNASGAQVWEAYLKVTGYRDREPLSGSMNESTVAQLGGEIAVVSGSGERRVYKP